MSYKSRNELQVAALSAIPEAQLEPYKDSMGVINLDLIEFSLHIKGVKGVWYPEYQIKSPQIDK